MDSLHLTNIQVYMTVDCQSFPVNMCTLVFHSDLFDKQHSDHRNHMDLFEPVLLSCTKQMRLRSIRVGSYNLVCDLRHHSEHFLHRFPDMDLHNDYLYMSFAVNSPCSSYIQVGIPHMDRQSSCVYRCKYRHCNQHSNRKVMDHTVCLQLARERLVLRCIG